MDNKTRIIVNTIAQNLRSIINIVLSLYSTRIVMDALGQSDYGIYMLVAGVVSLLNFFTNSLTITTQRHLSFCHGSGRKDEAKAYFANSYLLLLLFGITLSVVLASFTSFFFDSEVLKVVDDRLTEAKLVYLLVIGTVFTTLVTSPYKALLISHENIVYISIIEVLDGILKLSAVFVLYYLTDYRLTTYALIILMVMLFNMIAFMIYCQRKYSESCIIPSPKQWDLAIQKKIIGFATWSLYGMACIFFRTQGVAVIINQIYKGTILNSSYGIATQVQGSVNFFSSAIHNAIKPQIIKAEGAGDYKRAIQLSETACKYGFLILMLVVIPIIAELPLILQFWLKDVPPLCIIFCSVVLISSLTDQLSLGLTLIVSAKGRIRNFSLWSFTIKALTIPAIYIGVRQGFSISECFIYYWVFEFLSSIVSILYICNTTAETLVSYIKNVLIKVLPPLLGIGLAGYSSTVFFEPSPWRIIVTGIITSIIGLILIVTFALTQRERSELLTILTTKIKSIFK